jgi:hypothetical protein
MVAGLLLSATPAAAGCGIPEMDELLKEGKTLGIVTRTDEGDGPRSTYRVEAEFGGDLPAEVSGPPDGVEWGPSVLPRGLGALMFEHKESWEFVPCAEVPLGPAIQRATGSPPVVSKGPAVAIAAGRFGGSRLVALDRRGRPVAWDGRAGRGTQVSACPGGQTVAATGRTGERYYPNLDADLTLHDAVTLRPRRTLKLPVHRESQVLAMRCADARGNRVDILLVEFGGSGTEQGRLLSVTGKRMEVTKLGRVVAAAPVDGGFLALALAPREAPTLVEVASGGARRVVATFDDLSPDKLAVSPDGRTVAVSGTSHANGRVLRTLDARTGALAGEWGTDKVGQDAYVNGIAWSASNRLLARVETGRRGEELHLISFDRALREGGRGVAEPGWKFTAIGEAGVSYSGARMRASSIGSAGLTLDELRLADAQHLTPLTDKGFDPAPAALDVSVDVPVEEVVADADSSTGPWPGVLAGTAAVVAGSLAFGFARRRRARSG